MSFQSFARIGKAFDDGKYHYQYVTKTTTPNAGSSNLFVDMNQTSGQPKYNAFAGSSLAFTQLVGSGNAGVYSGPFITGSTKHLLRWQTVNINTTTSSPPDYVHLCDYLGFYPLIDCDETGQQDLDNTSTLPRYTDGEGVRIVLITQAPMTVTAPVTISYVNSLGNSRSSTHNVSAGNAIGVCVSTSGTTGGVSTATPFFPLAGGCSGVRYIESITFGSGAGGFICAALVKPLATIMNYESTNVTEKNFGFDTKNLPEIKEGAYLNFLIQRSTSASASLRSELVFINS